MSHIDPETGLDAIEIQPAESLLIDIPLGGKMRFGDSIGSITDLYFTPLGDANGVILISGQVFSGSIVQARFEAPGTSCGERYKISVVVQTVLGDTVEDDKLLKIVD